MNDHSRSGLCLGEDMQGHGMTEDTANHAFCQAGFRRDLCVRGGAVERNGIPKVELIHYVEYQIIVFELC